MSECPDQSDFCPHCQSEVEISFLEFSLRITAKILTCPGAARNVVGIRGAISSNVKLSDHAARSIG
jgi:hypothetical protein